MYPSRRIAEIEKQQLDLKKRAEQAREEGHDVSYLFLSHLARSLEIDKLFVNPEELIAVYQNALQARTIEVNGFAWPIDTLIVRTSNRS